MKNSILFKKIALALFLFASYTALVSFENGIVGFTMKSGTKIGCACHDLFPEVRVSVEILGPSSVVAGQTAAYILRISGGPGVAGGCNIASSIGDLFPSPADTFLRRDEQFPGAGFELTHKEPKLFDQGAVEFVFEYTAPLTPGIIDTIYANGNSADFDMTEQNDKWNFAENFTVSVIENPLPVELSSFTHKVSGNSVELAWTTLTEENNRGFDIERRQSAGNWKKAGHVPGKGNSSSPVSYEFIDRGLMTGKYEFRLNQLDYNGNISYFYSGSEVSVGVPERFVLCQNFPNPFNPSTSIKFEIPFATDVRLTVFDMSGRLIATLTDEFREAGYYSVEFSGEGLSSGVYHCRLEAAGNIDTKKMMLIK